MLQTKFSLKKSQQLFLSQYRQYGFKDKSAMIRAALVRLQRELETQTLRESADLYATLYEEDQELQEWTESAVLEWSE